VCHSMVSKGLALTVKDAESSTSDALIFNLDELKKHKGKLLGRGAFGKVYAINGFPSLAVKEIWLKGQPDRLVEITKFELEALSQFSHPGVLKYHQVLTEGDFLYVVMDRYDGDLQHFIADHRRTQKPIPRESMLSIMRQLADALAYVHAPYKVNERGDVLPGIVHRDLKPANVLMSKDGEHVAIADFGLCKDAQHDGGTLAGTKAYMAPETLLSNKTSRASDIWALGVIIYELVTLELPSFSHHWEPEDAKEFFIPEWKPDLSAVEDDFIRGILKRIFILDPEERPTARELRDLLWELDASDAEAKPRISALEAALKDARANNLSLKKGLQTRLTEINSLRDTVATQAAELNFLRESLKKLAAQDPSWTPLMRAAAAGDIKAVKKHLSKKGKKDVREDVTLMLAARMGHRDIVELLDPTDENGVTALMRAVMRNDVEAVKVLVLEQKKLKDNNGRTALIHAAQRGCKEAVEVLLEHEKRMRDNQNHNALYHALRNRHIEAAKTIIPHEDPTDENGVTALMRAVNERNAGMVELLASLQKEAKDKDGNTALMIAAKAKHTDIVDLLDPTDCNGVTALMRAADRNDVEAVKILIPIQKGRQTSREVNINGWNTCKGTALMIAAERGYTEIVAALAPHEKGLTDSSGNTALMLAANNAHTEAVRVLAEHERGARDTRGRTALMTAAQRGDLEMVRVLVEHEKGITNEDGHTALVHAARAGHREITELLMEHEKDVTDWTMLMCAAVLGDTDMVSQYINERGQKDKLGRTALILAAQNRRDDAVKLLMKHEGGASGWTSLICAAYLGDVDVVRDNFHEKGCKDVIGRTALMLAAHRGHTEVVRILVEEEGGMQNNDGVTALIFAARYGHSKCVRLLLEKEGGMQDKDGWTALMLAAYNDHVECVRLLAEREKDIKTTRECYGYSPGTMALDFAKRKGYTEIISILSG
ncbi:Ankyrin repeat protein, partial [Giardia duodenalis]